MTDSDLERIFAALARGVDAAPDGAAPFLGRLALLLAAEVGDAAKVEALARAAAEAGLSRSPCGADAHAGHNAHAGDNA